MLRSCEYSDESPKHQLEAALRVLWRKIGNRRLVSDDEPQLRDELYHEQSVQSQRLTKGVAPDAELCFALAQKRTNEAPKGLRQSRIGNVTLVLVELAGGKEAARRNERLMVVLVGGLLAENRILGNEDQKQSRA